MQQRERKRGDRRDAYRIKDIDGFHSIVPYVMPERTQSEVSLVEQIDVTELLKFIEEKNKNEGVNLKLFHAICTAMAKTVYMRPLLNSFVSGRRYWQRFELTLSFVVKRQFSDSAEESLMVLTAKPEYTIYDISKLILGDVEKVRSAGKNHMDDLMKTIGSMPRFVLSLFFWTLSRLEYHGKMPQSLTDGDTNYTSVLLANLGSIKCNAPYHHLNNYGTNSVMGTIGVLHKENVIDADGNSEIRDIVNLCMTIDERIADGFYFAKSIKLLKHLLANPELLEKPLEENVDYAN